MPESVPPQRLPFRSFLDIVVPATVLPSIALWAAMAFSVAAGWLFPGSALSDVLLPFGMRLCLLAGEVFALAAVIVAVPATLRLMDKTTGRMAPRAGSAMRAMGRFLIAGGLLFAYVGSWTLFWATGQFFDDRSLEFLFTNGWMVLGYARQMNRWLLAGVPLASVLAAGIALAVAPRLRDALPERSRRSLTFATAGLIVTALLAFLLGQGYHGRMTWIVNYTASAVRCPAATWY